MFGVLFLDIDGVLCTDRAYYASGQDKTKTILRTYDPIAIKMVDRLCQDYNLKVVISSTWRNRYDVPLILLTHGFVSDFHEDDKTPTMFLGSTRGREIKSWLDDHEEITNFIIIDDETSGIKDTPLEKFHCKTDYYNGMLYEHFLEAKKILDKQVNGELKYDREAF